jgi:hypothetical protein
MIEVLLAAGTPHEAVVKAVRLIEEQAREREEALKADIERRKAKQLARVHRFRSKSETFRNVAKRDATHLAREGAPACSLLEEEEDNNIRYLSDIDRRTGEKAQNVLADLPPQPDTAGAVHGAAIEALRAAGFEVRTECGVDDRGDGRSGRVDIVAEHDGGSVAIEIDHRNPRQKSVHKLRRFSGFRLLALRGIALPNLPDGIDGAVSIPVRRETGEEGADKRSVNRAGRLPKNWKPSEALITFGVNLDMAHTAVTQEADKFIDHWHAASGPNAVKVDWDAAFRNWLRNAVKFDQARAQPRLSVVSASHQPRKTKDERTLDVFAEFAEMRRARSLS